MFDRSVCVTGWASDGFVVFIHIRSQFCALCTFLYFLFVLLYFFVSFFVHVLCTFGLFLWALRSVL